VTGRWTGHGLCLTGRVRSVFSVCAISVFDRTRWRVRSLSIGRVRSFRELTGLQPDAGTVASGQFYSASGRCFVVRCSGLTSASSQSRDQRVRSIPARSVCASCASGRCFVDSRCATGTSGQLDQRVRSARLRLFQVSNSYIRRGTSINTRWPAQGSISWIFDILVSTLS
jgi:hypothetical protein